ncbi:hypothetical protein KCP74_21765 [Salmonella enterica subsp. enterica]|nr:hypothetical protein KCP74_21765 [Salmonella enterica subsp. enterica]
MPVPVGSARERGSDARCDHPLHLRTRRAPPVARLNAGVAAAVQPAAVAPLLIPGHKRRGGGYRFHWRYGRRDRYRRPDRHVLFTGSGIG